MDAESRKVTLRVDAETRARIKILAAQDRVEMWELVRRLVAAEYRRRGMETEPP